MIDYVKAVLLDVDLAKIIQHPLLEFTSIFNESTGELSQRKKAEYKGIQFIADHRTVRIQGSFHKFWNEGLHNYNDFGVCNLSRTLNEISQTFNFDLATARLENLEVGVNLELPFSTSNVLTNLISHRNQKFRDMDLRDGQLMVADHNRYRVKIYDKGRQFNLQKDLLRIELHYNRMFDLSKNNIQFLSDFLSKDKREYLSICLLKEWDQVLLFDWTLDKNELSKRLAHRDFFQWRNYEYWAGLNKSNRNKRRKVYSEMVEKYSGQVHSQILQLTVDKLVKLEMETGDLLTQNCLNEKATV